jgi:hypothetical protein
VTCRKRGPHRTGAAVSWRRRFIFMVEWLIRLICDTRNGISVWLKESWSEQTASSEWLGNEAVTLLWCWQWRGQLITHLHIDRFRAILSTVKRERAVKNRAWARSQAIQSDSTSERHYCASKSSWGVRHHLIVTWSLHHHYKVIRFYLQHKTGTTMTILEIFFNTQDLISLKFSTQLMT